MVKRGGGGNQVWSVEKLDQKLTDLREQQAAAAAAAAAASDDSPMSVDDDSEDREDPFDENTESHNLIGVANVFLSCLSHDVAFDYYTPIISQQGEVAGRLQVNVQRTEGAAVPVPGGAAAATSAVLAASSLNSSSSVAQSDAMSEASTSSAASSTRLSNGETNGSEEGNFVKILVTYCLINSCCRFLYRYVCTFR